MDIGRAIDTNANWDTAPKLMDIIGVNSNSVIDCDIEYWIHNVAQGTLSGLVNGHKPRQILEEHMTTDGPLRDSLIKEMAFRFKTESVATKGLCELTAIAPNTKYMEFFVTQVMDEARHAHIFKNHILELGIPKQALSQTIELNASHDEKAILAPMHEWAMGVIRDEGYFYGGVAIITILLEGVLAPAAALSEIKWRPLNPMVADIEKGANIDEVRHLNVGAQIIKDHLKNNPRDKGRLLKVITEGRAIWGALPVSDMIYERECLFQEGISPLISTFRDYELISGMPLSKTTPESRMELSFAWSHEMQLSRLKYMGLSEAI